MKSIPACFLFAFLLLSSLVQGCAISHSASIQIQMPDKNGGKVTQVLHQENGEKIRQEIQKHYREYDKQALADFEAVVKTMDSWGKHYGFCRIPPEQYPAMRLKHFSTASDSKPQIAYYEEHRPANPEWPIQIMAWFDLTNPYPGINITMIEGYHRHPSALLEQAHATLKAQLSAQFGYRIKASMDK